jgi:trans-2,3-dihydro-3-hydroxyanthranilate isomerase
VTEAGHRYLHLDVFTTQRFAGNPLAVFPDARGVTEAQMQAIAAEIGFSETAFVLPSIIDVADARLRIFTPTRELPMAGHPTVGSTFALALEGVIEAGAERFTWELGVGPTPVDLNWRAGALSFAWMTQPPPQFGDVLEDLDAITAAIGVAVGDLDTRAPAQTVSAGVPFLFVPLRTREAIDRASPDLAAMRALEQSHSIEHYFICSAEPGVPPANAYSRMFAPLLGIAEDPATGGASGPLGAYLLRYGLVPRPLSRSLVSLQGAAMGRPSTIHIDVELHGDEIERVRVGGAAVLVATGTMHVD